MDTRKTPPLRADEISTTAAFVLPVRHLMWITNEAARIARRDGCRPNKSEVVREVLERAMAEEEIRNPQEMAS